MIRYTTQWCYEISVNNTPEEDLLYYIAKNDHKEEAVFSKHDPVCPISRWWKNVYVYALSQDKFDYYIAKNHNNEYAIFNVNNPNEPISQWWQ